MKSDKPALGIMKTHEFDDTYFYKVECCSCGQNNHVMEFSIEIENEGNTIDFNTYIKPESAYWKNLVKSSSKIENSFLWSIDYSIRQLVNGLYHRFKVTWEVWSKGYVEYYHTTSMTEQQALNYCDAIKDAIKKLKKAKK